MSNIVVSVPSDPGLRDALGAAEGVEFIDWDLDGPAPRSRIDIVIPPYWEGPRPLAHIAGIEVSLVQWQSIGYNGVDKHLPEGVRLANAATVHETSTAELAVGLALAAQRGIPEFIADGRGQRWDTRSFPSLADRSVLLIGYGGVSKAIEARLAGFEARITRLARSARDEQNLAGETVHVHGFDELHQLLAAAEVVVLAVPLTPDTRGLIDGAALAQLPDGALVVNVARGPVVDTDALLAELQGGRLRAALDVTDPEPLPAGHPLWDAPNTLITPHVGGDSSAMLPRVVALIHRQIARMRAGETPENLVLGPGA